MSDSKYSVVRRVTVTLFITVFVTVCYGMLRYVTENALFRIVPRLNSQWYCFSQHWIIKEKYLGMVMVEEWPRSGTFYYGLVTAGYGYQALPEWKHIPVPPCPLLRFLLRFVTVCYGILRKTHLTLILQYFLYPLPGFFLRFSTTLVKAIVAYASFHC